MHLGYSNAKHEYELDGTTLDEMTEEKDRVVLIDNELKFSKHIKSKVSQANRLILLIKISFETLDDDMFKNLYNTLIPHPPFIGL